TVERASSPHCARTEDTDVHYECRDLSGYGGLASLCVDTVVHPGTSFQIPYDEPEIAPRGGAATHPSAHLDRARSDGRSRCAAGGDACRRRTAGRGHESSAGPWDCPSDRAVGQIRSARRT